MRRYVAWLEAAEVAPPVRPHLPDALPALRRALGLVVLAGLLVALVAAAGSIDEVADEVPLGVLTVLLGLPVALVAGLERGSALARRVGSGVLVVAGALLVALVLPVPMGGALHAHWAATLLLVASCTASAVYAGVGRPPALRLS